MSHYTVMLKVSKDFLEDYDGNLESAIENMLAKYCEQDEDFFEFEADEDAENSAKESYEKNKDVDETFEEYATNQGYALEDGCVGYKRNPNAKWDWFQVGGRWAGMLPLKNNVPSDGKKGEKSWGWKDENPYEEVDGREKADFAQIQEVDWKFLHHQAYANAAKAFKEYQEWVDSGFPYSWDAHHRAYNLDCVTLLNLEELDAYREKRRQCETDEERESLGDEPERKFKYKTFKNEEEFLAKCVANWAFSAYSVLDADGWHAPGEMGWFGCSSEETDDRLNWDENFMERFIENEDPETVIVMVDCHI